MKFARGSSNARSVVILFRNGFYCKIKQKIVDPMGKRLGIEAEINDENDLLLKVYAPNNDNQISKFYEHIVNIF